MAIDPLQSPAQVEANRQLQCVRQAFDAVDWDALRGLEGHPLWRTYASQMSGQSFLHLAVLHGKPAELIPYLLGQGARLEATDKKGYQPIHNACMAPLRRRLEMLQALVSHGAALDTPTPDGATPLGLIMTSTALDCLQWLIAQGARPSTEDWRLVETRAGDARLLSVFWETFGPPGDAHTCTQWALRAAEKRRTGMVLSLMPYGVDPTASQGDTLLLTLVGLSRRKDAKALTRELVLAGADAQPLTRALEGQLGPMAGKGRQRHIKRTLGVVLEATATRLDAILPTPASAQPRTRF